MAYCILKSYKLKIEPLKIFEALNKHKNCFFLDSSLGSNYSLGRYSFLGIDPFFIVRTKDGAPFEELRKPLNRYHLSIPKSNIPFLGGAVGYFAYDLGLTLEKKITRKTRVDLGIPDSFFGFYNTIIIIDHLKRLLYIFSAGFPETNYRLAKLLCEENFKKIHSLLSKIGFTPLERPAIYDGVKSPSFLTGFTKSSKEQNKPQGSRQLSSNFSKEEYLFAIKKAKEYIRRGDIYQVNLSQEFRANADLSAFEIYRRLRKISPSYFSAYLDSGDFQILSSSPERFLKLEDDIVITRPMKGTRPRFQNRLKDLKFKNELLASAKDKAELMMIVDLERNDLGRVCSYDSIKVRPLRELEEYSTVFQTTATVSGRLHNDKDRMDLLRACFPGGSITGCPKIRAMEIIEELEPSPRSIYTGALGYLSFSGGMDFNILIRTILKKCDKLYFGAGGGIVADSNPQDEYEETLIKARGMIEAITKR